MQRCDAALRATGLLCWRAFPSQILYLIPNVKGWPAKRRAGGPRLLCPSPGVLGWVRGLGAPLSGWTVKDSHGHFPHTKAVPCGGTLEVSMTPTVDNPRARTSHRHSGPLAPPREGMRVEQLPWCLYAHFQMQLSYLRFTLPRTHCPLAAWLWHGGVDVTWRPRRGLFSSHNLFCKENF